MEQKSSPTNAIRDALAAFPIERYNTKLVVASRSQAGYVDGGVLKVHDSINDQLRQIALVAKKKALHELDMSVYDGYTVLDPEEGLWVPSDRIRDRAPLLRFLETIEDKPALSAERLRKESISLSAIMVGPDSDRAYFVQESARSIRAGPRSFLGIVEGDTLRPASAAIVSIDERVDFILMDAGAVVFGARAFERYLQQPLDVATESKHNLSRFRKQIQIADHLASRMAHRAMKSVLMRGRLRSLLAKNYFANLTLDVVAQKLKDKDLHPADFIKNGMLDFDERDTLFVLKLLDNKVYRGDFDGQLYSTNAAPRAPLNWSLIRVMP
jgi:hypothetical protein